MTHEFSIVKILLDNPELAERAYALGISPAKAETDFLKETLLSYEKLKEDGVKPNRDNLIAFIDFLDDEDKQDFKAALNEVDESGGEPGNLEAHIKKVTDAWYLREVRTAFTRGFAELNESGDADTAVSNFKLAVDKLVSGLSGTENSLDLLSAMHEEYVKSLPDTAGQPDDLFGLESLDRVRGADPGTGELIVIAAGPKVGKSSLFNNILRQSVRKNRPTYFASAEMDARKSYERLLAAQAGISSRIAGSNLIFKNNAVREAYLKAIKEFSQKKIFVEFQNLSVPLVRSKVHLYYHKHGVRHFVFDRIGLFKEASGKDEFSGRRQVTKQLRTLANELPGVKIILGSQITNESVKSKDKRPSPAHVFGGNGSQADATQVFIINRPYHVDPSSEKFRSGPWQGRVSKGPGSVSFTEIYCGLNNNGPSNGSAYVAFDGDKQIFEDLNESKYTAVDESSIEEEILRIEKGENGFDIEEFNNMLADEEEEDDFDPEPLDKPFGEPKLGVPKLGNSGKTLF